MNSKKIWIVIFGIICIIAGIVSRKMTNLCTEKVTAKVVDHFMMSETDDDGNSRILYEPVIEYTYNGGSYDGHISAGEGYDIVYPQGMEIEIMINPANPKMFTYSTNDFVKKYFHFFFIGLGAIVCIYGVYAVLKKDDI